MLVPITAVADAPRGNNGEDVVPVDGDKKSRPAFLPVEIFQDTVPVPMKLPASQLDAGREPWFFME